MQTVVYNEPKAFSGSSVIIWIGQVISTNGFLVLWGNF